MQPTVARATPWKWGTLVLFLIFALGGGTLIAVGAYDGLGEVNATQAVDAGLGTVHMQVIDVSGCKITNTVVATF